MSIEILSEVNHRFAQARAHHREQADLFWFLALPGYAMLHEKQLAEESLTQRRLKRFMLLESPQMTYDVIPEDAGVLQPLVGSKKRTELLPDDRWSIIKRSFTDYLRWENNTLKAYELAAKRLFEHGCIAAYEFVIEIIRDVAEEVRMVDDMVVALSGMEWDLPTITDQQDRIAAEYEKKIKKLYKGRRLDD